MWHEHLSARSQPVRNTVEAGAVRRFAEAIGDLNPLYLDEEAAARSRWGRRIAPPTFPRTFDYGRIDELHLPPSGIIHGEQTYTYTRPLFVGEDLYCSSLFKDTYTRQGRDGILTFLVFERVAEAVPGEPIMRTHEVYILTARVKMKGEE